MWRTGILARAQDAGNASHLSRTLRALLHAWRRGGLLRTIIMMGICGLLLGGVPMPAHGLFLPVTMLFLGETELALGPSFYAPYRVIAWRLVNTVIAATTLLIISEDWVATASFGLFVVSCSGLVGGRGLLPLTAAASIANLVLPMLVRVGMGAPDPFHVGIQSLVVSVMILPGAALLLHLRSHRLLKTQSRLSDTIEDLEAAQSDLRASEQRLQHWNEQLNVSIVEQTAQLEERNRYLSIINAVSFALAEPMDDFRSLERAARLVARLMGARGAQAFERFGVGDGAHLFVTVISPQRVGTDSLFAAVS